ncbi:MAG: hypothetical protein JNM17_06705 [Archangium sp.]|nr:hypothetical protein [Archangium sp.]
MTTQLPKEIEIRAVGAQLVAKGWAHKVDAERMAETWTRQVGGYVLGAEVVHLFVAGQHEPSFTAYVTTPAGNDSSCTGGLNLASCAAAAEWKHAEILKRLEELAANAKKQQRWLRESNRHTAENSNPDVPF